MSDAQQHEDAHRNWKTQVVGQMIGTVLGMGALTMLGWIGTTLNENNEALSRVEQTLSHAIDRQEAQGIDIDENTARIRSNRDQIRQNEQRINRNKRQIQDESGEAKQ